MKGIYFTTMCNVNDPADTADPGIKKKICQQLELFRAAGIQMYFFYPQVNSRLYRFVNRLPLYRDHFRLDPEIVKEAGFIYLRKPSAINMGFIRMLKTIRRVNPAIRILLEIPTYPYDREIRGLVRLPLKWKDRYARRALRRYVDVVLTYSDDKEIFGIKTINISNGVDAAAIAGAVKRFPHPEDGILRFMACARFNPWHGYDRAIEGLRAYLGRPDADRNIEIEMVGDGPSLGAYRQLVEQYGLQEHVKFHGKLQGEALARVYSACDIGLDSLGRHRSGVYYNSSLKGKEYCAYGLLIVSGVETELDHDGRFGYYCRIPADDTPVDFEQVLRFYNAKTNNGKDRQQAREEIMEYARSTFAMEVVFQPVLHYIFSK